LRSRRDSIFRSTSRRSASGSAGLSVVAMARRV
jgi:hypothetical protein